MFQHQPSPLGDDTPSTSRRRFGRPVLLAVTAAAVGLAAVSTGSAGAAAANPAPAGAGAPAGVAVHTVSAAEQRAAAGFWTSARLHAAKSVDLVSTAKPTISPAAAAAKPTGRQGQVAPIAPTAGRSGAGAQPASYTGGAVPFASYTTYPYAVNGRIFFTNNGLGYSCSGTSVTAYSGSTPRSEVWTAGHCTSNTSRQSPGVWDSSAVFIPAYNGGYSDKAHYAPFGIFTAGSYSTSTNWLYHGDLSVDLGAFTVGTSDTTGRTLPQSVGTAGFMWNANATQTFSMFGYPAESPYSGRYRYRYQATTAGRDTGIGGSGQAPIVTNNPMTGGSSGGEWAVGWSTSGTGWINGHNDYVYNGSPNYMYSPYFDTLANTVRCFGASSC